MPRTGLEPACLSTHAPETCASTNSATWAYTTERYRWSEKRDSNPRPQPWQGCALPTELFSPFKISIYSSGTLSKSRAKNGTRTRDPNLGKVVLHPWATRAFLIFYLVKCSLHLTNDTIQELPSFVNTYFQFFSKKSKKFLKFWNRLW